MRVLVHGRNRGCVRRMSYCTECRTGGHKEIYELETRRGSGKRGRDTLWLYTCGPCTESLLERQDVAEGASDEEVVA